MRNFRFLLLLALAVHILPALAQIKINTYTTATDTFYWKRYIRVAEPPRARLSKYTAADHGRTAEAFLARNLGQFPQYTTDSLPKYTPATLRKCLYPIDINGDRVPDLIFSGYGGDGTDLVRIYINRNDSFELVFEDYQYISTFTRQAGKLTALSTGDVGSGKNYLYFTREYRVDWDRSVPSFVRMKQVVNYMNTEEPTRNYPVPGTFVAKTDTMMLRASANQQNEPFLPDLDSFGNIIAKYRSKARGAVLAIKSYGKGNDWYFVEVWPDTPPSASILYGLDRMPTFVRGWVSGQAILREMK